MRPFGRYRSELRAVGEDWPLFAHTMVGVKRLENLRQLAQRAIDEGNPGDFIETGIWRGGCCILLRRVLAANCIKDRKVYAADFLHGHGLRRSRDLVPKPMLTRLAARSSPLVAGVGTFNLFLPF